MGRLSIFAFASLLFVATAQALWAAPDAKVPVARLVANLEQQLAAAPEDPHLLARVARVHSMVYVLGDVEVPVVGRGDNPKYTYYEQGLGYPSARHSLDREAISARIGRLLEAIRLYEKATKLAPEDRYIWLGLGYCYDEMSHAAVTLAWPTDTAGAPVEAIAALRKAWEDQAVSAYAKAMGDAPKVSQGFLVPPVELEAGRYLRAILEPREALSDDEKTLVAAAQRMEKLDGPRSRVVTPIIFPLDGARSLESLLAAGTSVGFDLDGQSAGAKWPWVKGDTALLVWDPEGLGQIRSGRQLIGSVTWWLFWENGYTVLRALDDDRNGWLEGAELDGLAAWQDGNGNGVSDAGEVRPLSAIGVRRLAAMASGSVNDMPMNNAGLELADGRVLPTYDWITGPIGNKH
ncbi:MAG: hypothetical protein JNK74_17235 [Candidatus Hydrogenedentes bacterium]|nr:hypothetical protein [Candidatus Hydrogenedentota bacterium]